jgi:ribonucleoside-diphosphate reductase alpha chain
VRLWTIVLEISVMMAQFPSKQIAQNCPTNTARWAWATPISAACLMTSGIPYDSPEGRAICGALTAIMTGVAYATSAEMAKRAWALPGYEANARTCCA